MINVLACSSKDAAFVFFGLFARKLILCGEVAGVLAVIGWRVDGRLGFPLGRSKPGRCVAGTVLLAQVLLVAFIRDFSELGSHPSFTSYAASCLACIALIVAVCATFTAVRWRLWADLASIGVVFGAAMLCALALDEVARIAVEPLTRVGEVFGARGAGSPFHGIESFVTAAPLFGLFVGRKASFGSSLPRLTRLLGVFAGVQGFLAFRGVSAVYILMGLAIAFWLRGWRVYQLPGPWQIAWGRPGAMPSATVFLASFSRQIASVVQPTVERDAA